MKIKNVRNHRLVYGFLLGKRSGHDEPPQKRRIFMLKNPHLLCPLAFKDVFFILAANPRSDKGCLLSFFSPGSLAIHGSLCMVKMDPTVGCQLMIWLDIASQTAQHSVRMEDRSFLPVTRRMKSRWRLFRLGSTHARVWQIKRHKL